MCYTYVWSKALGNVVTANRVIRVFVRTYMELFMFVPLFEREKR